MAKNRTLKNKTIKNKTDRKMLEMLVCPLTGDVLRYDEQAQELISPRARLAYAIRDGVPIMLAALARPLDTHEL